MRLDQQREEPMNRRLKFVPVLLAIAFLFTACTGAFQNLTPKQKYYLTRLTFNDVVGQYTEQAKLQPESVKVKLRQYVNPVIRETAGALDIYKAAVGTPDESLKRGVYIGALDKMLDLFLKYGITIKEE